MKKRLKKANAELRQVVSDIADALVVLNEVDKKVNERRDELREVVVSLKFAKMAGDAPANTDDSMAQMVLEMKKDLDSLTVKHNSLAEVVRELNMESHTHWWK